MARAFFRRSPADASDRLGRVLTDTIAELQSGAPLRRVSGDSIMSSTPSSLVDRVRQVRARHAAALAATETKLTARLDAAAQRGDEALRKLDAKLASDAEAAEAEVRGLEDEVNQLTNGGD